MSQSYSSVIMTAQVAWPLQECKSEMLTGRRGAASLLPDLNGLPTFLSILKTLFINLHRDASVNYSILDR